MDKLSLFKDKIGLFTIIDYFTAKGMDTAVGILESVSNEGYLLVRHIDNKEVTWGLNINQIRNYKFSPIQKGDRHD